MTRTSIPPPPTKTSSSTKTSTSTSTLTSLPPELLLQITDHLPTASSLASLEGTNQKFQSFLENEAWRSFARNRFPSLCPAESPSFKTSCRSLTTLSRAWDRRAFLARCVLPRGEGITAWPAGRRVVGGWRRPAGQTIGFIPFLDVYEEHLSTRGGSGGGGGGREEVLAFSAGAEVCLRRRKRRMKIGEEEEEEEQWMTYKPLAAREGRDDVTCLHLLRPTTNGREGKRFEEVLTGTANGDLQLTRLPWNDGDASSSSDDDDDATDREDVKITYFTTQGQPVRSSSLLQQQRQHPNHSCHPAFLATSLGDSRLALYEIDQEKRERKVSPCSQVDLPPILRADGHPVSQRIWSTKFLSQERLAVGIGPSRQPIQIFEITSSGIGKEPLRRFGLLEDENISTQLDDSTSTAKQPRSSIYTIEPLPPSSSSSSSSSNSGNLFLSGAYDGIVRLHDLRSPSSHEKFFMDPGDDSPIYSILPQGRERILVGTGRHNLLKCFDARMGGRWYDSFSADSSSSSSSSSLDGDRKGGVERKGDYNLYLRTTKDSGRNGTRMNWSRGGGGGGGGGRGTGRPQHRRPVESSVYSLASSSPDSPFFYAGVEGSMIEIAVTETLDRNPDPGVFFRGEGVQQKEEFLDLAMHEQGSMVLWQQRSLGQTFARAGKKNKYGGRVGRGYTAGLDVRWKSSAEGDDDDDDDDDDGGGGGGGV